MASDTTPASNVKTFIYTLCRHGETQANKDGIIQGQLDVPLSSTGEEQAMLLGKRLLTETFTRVYSSDLSRAKSTAEAVITCNSTANTNGNSVGSNSTGPDTPLVITTDQRIRERNFGKFENQPLSVFRSQQESSNLPLYLRSPHPSVETIEQFMDRTVSFFKEVCVMVANEAFSQSSKPAIINSGLLKDGSVLPVEHVLVAAHGGVVRMHLMYFEACRYYIPGSTTRASPNTALTSFLVSIDQQGNCIDAKCLCLHDNSHVTQTKIS